MPWLSKCVALWLQDLVLNGKCYIRRCADDEIRARKIHMNVGVGFRHISSRTAGIDNYNGANFILGFGI